ncbi:MAG: hypothetical protein JO353_13865 [Phycisphaerae bacterium]|nr:hypothetical protein [Phycisphaerae bacterium]
MPNPSSNQVPDPTPPHPRSKPGRDPAHVSDPNDGEKTLEENTRLNASGLSWDETEPKPNEKFNRVTEMGEAD